MYADRYGKTGIKPGALTIAVGLNAAVLAALIFSGPEIFERPPPEPFEAINIPLPVPPPPIEPVETKIVPQTRQTVIDPPPVERPVAQDPIAPSKSDFTIPAGPTGMDGGVTGGTGGVVTPYEPPRTPVTIGAKVDPRYARFLQPDYPPGERRMGREGKVVVRVLVGIDGRVAKVELLSAVSDAFFAATRKQALEKWRFTPATRDGVPQEDWRTMTVTFVLNDTE